MEERIYMAAVQVVTIPKLLSTHQGRKFLECHVFNMQASTSELILWQRKPRWKQTLYKYAHISLILHDDRLHLLARTGFILNNNGAFVHLSHMSVFCSTLYMFRLIDKTVALMRKTCAGILFFHPEQQNWWSIVTFSVSLSKTAVWLCFCEDESAMMDLPEGLDEGILPSKVTSFGEHDSLTKAQRWGKSLNFSIRQSELHFNDY